MLSSKPFRVVLLFLVISLIGLALINRLSIDLLPQFKDPTLQVVYGLLQSPPEIIERELTSPLENVLSQLADLKKINSVSRYDRGAITLEFSSHVDIAIKRFEVAALIRQIYPKLPPESSYPQIFLQSQEQSDEPILIYSLNAPISPLQIQEIGKQYLKAPLSANPAIERIDIQGAEPLEMVVKVDRDKMLQYRIFKEDIINTLKNISESNELSNVINQAGQSVFIKIKSQITSLKEIENVLIKTIFTTKQEDDSKQKLSYPLTQAVYLKDIAKIYFQNQEAENYFRVNSLNSVNLVIYPKEKINQIQLAQDIEKRVQSIKYQLPKGFQIIKDFDRTTQLKDELQKLYQRIGLSMAILITMIIVLYRNVRYLLVLLSSLLVNLCITVIFLYFLSVDVHLYSLAGFTLSFGLVLDNAIVMLDHIHKRGNLKAILALSGATLTTTAALGLIFFLPKEDQFNLTDFAIIIIINLGSSLFTALFYTPAIYQLIIKSGAIKRSIKTNKSHLFKGISQTQVIYVRFITFLRRFNIAFTFLLILGFGLPVFMLPNEVSGWRFYNENLGSRYYQNKIKPYIDNYLGGALRLFYEDVYENSGYREPTQLSLHLETEMPFGTTLEQMNELIKRVEQFLNNLPGLEKFVTQVKSGQYANIDVTFNKKYIKTNLPYTIKAKLISLTQNLGGAIWTIWGIDQAYSNSGSNSLASFRVKMQGYNSDQLEKYANLLAEKLLKSRRIREVNINEKLNYNEKSSQEFTLNINVSQLNLLNISQQKISNALKNSSKSLGADLYINYQGQNLPISIQEKDMESFAIYHVKNVPVQLDTNQFVKTTDYSSLKLNRVSNALHKENRQYIRVIGFDYLGEGKLGKEFVDQVLQELKVQMPPGFEAKVMTYNYTFEQAQRQYILLAVLFIITFFICAILFESLIKPLWVILTIPISFIGLFLIFAWGGFYFDQGGYAAFVLLGGLSVNASIFIMNDFNNLSHIHNHNERVIKALGGKVRAIFLTTVSTILGLIPFLTEGDTEVFWFSLAIGSIGGLAFSLFAVFICLPVWMFKREDKTYLKGGL